MFKSHHPRSSIVLELSADGLARRVVFRSGEERGIVVGSTPSADFCVSGVRVEPVEFHFERGDEAIWLIPAYGIRDLRLNAGRVSGKAPLEAYNIIEFGGVRLGAMVSDERTGELDT
jgi:hypothetical protein